MTVNFNNIISTTLSVLNSKVADAFNGTRTGSFFFAGDQELTFTRFMPKGQVTEDTEVVSNQGFGIPFERDEIFRINIHFFTKHGDIGSGTNYKNRALCVHYLNLIKTTIIQNIGSFGQVIPSFDTIERPVYIEDQQVYAGTVPVLFKTRAL